MVISCPVVVSYWCISVFLDGWRSCSCSTLKSVEFIWMTNWWSIIPKYNINNWSFSIPLSPVQCSVLTELVLFAEERRRFPSREAVGSKQWVSGRLSPAQQNREVCDPWTSAPDVCKWRKLRPSRRITCRYPRWPGMHFTWSGSLKHFSLLVSRWTIVI